jgi:hypothetical protein
LRALRLLLIAQLYGVERMARERGLCGEELRLLREHGSRPVLDRLRTYLLELQDQLLPESEAGQAVAYTLKNWIALTRYCDNPDLSIDNNATERALRCFAVGCHPGRTGGSRPRVYCHDAAVHPHLEGTPIRHSSSAPCQQPLGH